MASTPVQPQTLGAEYCQNDFHRVKLDPSHIFLGHEAVAGNVADDPDDPVVLRDFADAADSFHAAAPVWPSAGNNRCSNVVHDRRGGRCKTWRRSDTIVGAVERRRPSRRWTTAAL